MDCRYKINKKATGLKLYRLIAQSKMTYAEIADILGLHSPRVIYDWVNGEKLPSTENYYTCTDIILAGLGQMYVADERFKSNIDKYADGTAEYASKAIAIYTKRQTI